LLQSALARPRNLRAYGEPDAAALAAAYVYGIAATTPLSMETSAPQPLQHWCSASAMASNSRSVRPSSSNGARSSRRRAERRGGRGAISRSP